MTLTRLRRAMTALRKCAIAFPHTLEDFPWGHPAYKVKGKIFVAMHLDENKGILSMSLKLPVSGKEALMLPFAKPTDYGLGKSGWVTARFKADDAVPLDMLREWLDESFRAVAPKRVLAQLETAEEGKQKLTRKRKPKKRD